MDIVNGSKNPETLRELLVKYNEKIEKAQDEFDEANERQDSEGMDRLEVIIETYQEIAKDLYTLVSTLDQENEKRKVRK